MVAFIARTEADPFLYDKIRYTNEVTTSSSEFIHGEPGSRYKTIMMYYGNSIYIKSLFPHSSMVMMSPQNLYSYLNSWQNILFHECGHSTESFSSASNTLGLSETMFNISPQFVDVKIDHKILDDNCQILKEDIAKHEDIFSLHECIAEEKIVDIDQAIAMIKTFAQSYAGVAKLLFHNSAEVWQILGVMLLKHENKTTLYINTFSDFALSAHLGLPVRCDHLGYLESDLNKKENFNY